MENLFRQEVIEKKRQRLEGTISLVQPASFKLLTLLIVFVTFLSLVFLSLGSYSRKEKVSGVLQPNTGLIKLGAPQSGIVSQLMVLEGQVVEKGQPLLRIISERHGVEGVELNQSLINQYQFQLNMLKQQRSKQKVQNNLQIDNLKNNRVNFEKRIIQLELQTSIFGKRIEINNKIVDQITTLSGTGYISDLELKRQNDTLLSLEQQSSSIQSDTLILHNQIAQTDNQLTQLPIEQHNIISQIDAQIEDIKVQIEEIKQQRLAELRSPVEGIVSGILVKRGKSVSKSQNLLSILPKGSFMQAIVYVPSAAFGFIEKGQYTRIRYHAFPYEKFGVFSGEITEISANVILPSETDIPSMISEPSYRVIIKLSTESIIAYGKETPLKSGMKLDADIVIEERTLIHWLFDPIFSVVGRLK